MILSCNDKTLFILHKGFREQDVIYRQTLPSWTTTWGERKASCYVQCLKVKKFKSKEPQSRSSAARYAPFTHLVWDFLASVSCGPWACPLSGKSSQHLVTSQKHFQTLSPHFPLEKRLSCLYLFMSPAHLGCSGESSSTDGMNNWAATLLSSRKRQIQANQQSFNGKSDGDVITAW